MTTDASIIGPDEQTVRDFLHSRIAFWETLPYDWMELDEDTIDDLNLLNVPEDVLAAYQRTRADQGQRLQYARDYERYERSEAWARKIIAEANIQN